MSLQGKLLRGLKWYKFRDVDGVYPKDITNDSHKMEELNFYKDFIKDKDANRVHKILEKVRLYDLSNKPKLMEEAAKALEKIGIKEVTKVTKNSTKEK